MKKDAYVFRANAAALIMKDGQVLAFQRVHYPDVWQCSQGGVDVGETPLETVWREVKEETGLGQNDLELVAEYPDWLTYEYPNQNGDYYGQTQRWFLFRFVGDESHITLDQHEFCDWAWCEPADFMQRIAPEKQSLFEKLLAWQQTFAI